MKLKLLICIASIAIITADRHFWGRWISDYDLTQFIIDGIACGIIAFAVLKPFSNWLSNYSIGSVFEYLGINSLGLYVIHMALRYIFRNNGLSISVYTLLSTTVYFFILLLVSIGIVEILKKTLKEKSYIFGV